jgi:hypothetical protein
VWVFETIFVLSIIKNFTTEFKPDGIAKTVRDIKKIATRYLNNGFPLDFLMIIPFNFILVGQNSKLFFFIKTYRLVKGIKIFNVQTMISNIQDSSIKSMMKRIEKDSSLGEDQDQDHNSIESILILGNCLRTLKLVVIIIQISFFVGIFFLIFCQL